MTIPTPRNMRIRPALGLLLASILGAQANPTGGNVAAGSATIGGGQGSLTINQASNTAIIDWQAFSINSGETTKFIQPSATSAVLNRVLGGQTSLINGTLDSNGQVYLINGNGILVGKNGRVNTAGFTGSTRDLSDHDFLSGKFHYQGNNGAGVENLGVIKALGGDVILIGKTVENKGVLSAAHGTVGLAAADDVLIAQAGNQHVFVKASATAKSAAGQIGVSNLGAIAATHAELRAANGNLYALAINNAGTVRANTVIQQGGDIYLTSDEGTVRNTGTLNASATAARGKGGQVSLKSGGAAIQTGSILARGGTGGVGGNADVSGAIVHLNGGKIDLTSPGGKAGTFTIDPTDLEVVAGGGGSITTDPNTGGDVNDPGSSTIGANTVEGILDAGNNLVLNADNSITVSSALTWTTSAMLSLTTNNNGGSFTSVAINAPITATAGSGSLTITAGFLMPGLVIPKANVNVGSFFLTRGIWQQVAGQNGFAVTLPEFSVTQDFELGKTARCTFERFAGGDGSTGNPFQITDIYGLQGLASPSGFFYISNGTGVVDSFILNNDIDASGTKTWRNGQGFLPIGSTGGTASIGGTFNGNNHTIDGLWEHFDSLDTTPLAANDNGNLGLFSYTVGGSSIVDLALTNIDFNSADNAFGYVGAVVADNEGATLDNDSASGTIQGKVGPAAGGLVAYNNNGTITNSHSAVDISIGIYGTGSAVGGLVGDNEGAVSTSYSTGPVTITGQGQPSDTAATANGFGVGGFVGYEGAQGSIQNAYSTGDVTVSDVGLNDPTTLPVGGFVGEVDDGTISNVYSIGNVVETSPNSDNDLVGIFAGTVNSENVSGYARTDNQTGTSGALVPPAGGNADNIIGVDNSAGAILDASVISFASDPAWVLAKSGTGPTHGFPTLATGSTPPPPPMGDATTVTLTGPASIAYGDSLTLTAVVSDTTNPGTNPTGTVTFDESQDGTLTSLGTGTLTLVGGSNQATLTLAVPNPLNAGNYSLVAVYAGDTGFSGSDSTAAPLALNVARKALVLTAGDATKVYGSTTLAYKGQPFIATGLVAGTSDSVTDVTIDSPGQAATANVNGGTAYTLADSNAQGSGISNYAITYKKGTLTVTPATLTLAASDQTVNVGGKINTTPVENTTYTVTGLQNSDQLTAVLGTGPTLSSSQSTATAGTFTGAIKIDGTLNSSLGANYTLTFMSGNLKVNGANVPDSTTLSLGSSLGTAFTYGQGLTLTATLADLTTPGTTVTGGTISFEENGTLILAPVQVKGDTVTLDLPSLLGASATAYDFTASYSGTTAFAASMTTAPLSVTVGQKALLITAGTASKTYGSTTLNYDGQQFVASGLVSGTTDAVTGVTLASAGQAATAGVNGGTPYDLTASDAKGTGLGNYAITYATGTVTVNPAQLTLAALDQSVSFGTSINTTATLGGTYTVSGLQNTDQLTDLLASGPTLGTIEPTTTAGTFAGAITLAGALNGNAGSNYTLTTVAGNLTVQPQTVVPTHSLTFPEQQALAQATNPKANAEFGTFFAESDFVSAANSGRQTELSTASGEPPVTFHRSRREGRPGAAKYKGIDVLAHASSFTLGSR